MQVQVVQRVMVSQPQNISCPRSPTLKAKLDSGRAKCPRVSLRGITTALPRRWDFPAMAVSESTEDFCSNIELRMKLFFCGVVLILAPEILELMIHK